MFLVIMMYCYRHLHVCNVLLLFSSDDFELFSALWLIQCESLCLCVQNDCIQNSLFADGLLVVTHTFISIVVSKRKKSAITQTFFIKDLLYK